MKNNTIDEERILLESLGFSADLIDSPSGTRMIRVLFGDETPDEDAPEEFTAIDCGFACVA